MAIYKVTFSFSQANIGASESYLALNASAGTLGPYIQPLIDKRNACFFTTTIWTGVRIAEMEMRKNNLVAARRSNPYIPGTYGLAASGIALTVPAQGVRTTTDKTTRSDQGRACVQMRVVYDTDRSTTRYFGFVPDKILYDEPLSLRMGEDTPFGDAWELFRAELVSGRWGIRARNRGAGFTPINILEWVQAGAPPANIGVKIPDAPAPGIAEGDFVYISGVRRKGTDTLSYNGRYIVHSINSTLQPGFIIVYLKGTEAGNPQSVKLQGTISRIGHKEYSILHYIPWRAGVHKRGRPTGLLQGRRKTRASLDP